MKGSGKSNDPRQWKDIRVGGNSQKHILAVDARDVNKIEADACAVVVLVHHFDLIVDLRVSKALMLDVMTKHDRQEALTGQNRLRRFHWHKQCGSRHRG